MVARPPHWNIDVLVGGGTVWPLGIIIGPV
jgi:hypothetical protein